MLDFSADLERCGKQVTIGFTNHFSYTNMRRFVAESLGPHLVGICMPHADIFDSLSRVLGMWKRVCRKTPAADPARLRKLKKFVQRWCKKHLSPIEVDEDLSFETWLPQTNYSDARKQELRACWEECKGILSPEHLKVKAFVKDEFYPALKHVRAIMARTDYYKCFAGPLFKAIEKRLFKLDHFIKYVEVADRPRYIWQRMYAPSARYVATDYTAYESHFTRELMDSCEFVLYRYMFGKHADSKSSNAVLRILMDRNHVEFKDVFFKFFASRMSGEMNTSLGNGFSNLMFMLFLCKEKGVRTVGVVEGDDGLFRCSDAPTEEDFASIGLTIKIEHHTELNKAAFCKIIFDVQEQTPVTNPLEVLAKFGWSKAIDVGMRHSRKQLLLRAKALSYLAQFPGCPVVQSLSLYVLRCTPNVSLAKLEHFIMQNRSFDLYEKERLLNGIRLGDRSVTPVGPGTRVLVEEVYGLRIADQHAIESYLDNLTTIQPLNIDPQLFPREWQVIGNDYCHLVPRADSKRYVAANAAPFAGAIRQLGVSMSEKHERMLVAKGLL